MAEADQLAEAKADYEDQVEELFRTEGLFEDLDWAPVFRGAAGDYLLQLVTVPFRRPGDDTTWSVLALAPTSQRWQGWAEHHARDQDRSWLAGIEHVWLTRAGHDNAWAALVHVHTGDILQPRPDTQPPKEAIAQ